MPAYPELFLLRHGQTEWNRDRRLQGRMNSPLTDLGLRQARRLGTLLARHLPQPETFSAFSSPQPRALETARLALAPIGMGFSQDVRLSELALGDWEGRTREDIAGKWPEGEALRENNPFLWLFHAPGGERFSQITDRARDFLEDLTGPAVIVAHGTFLRVLRGLWLGLDETGMQDLPGGQGIIFHLCPERGHRVLTG